MDHLRHNMANERERMVDEILANPDRYYVIKRGDDSNEYRIYTREEMEEFERRLDGIQGWVHTYRTLVIEPHELAELQEFQRERKTELLRLMERESRSYQGRYKFMFEVKVKLGKLGNDGVPDFMTFYMRQEEPKHVNYNARFDVHGAAGVLDRLF